MKMVLIISWACRLLVGMLFLASSVPKIAAPGRFFTQVMDYHVISPGAAVIVAVGLPWLELLLGLALLSGMLASGAFLLSTALLSVFAALQLWALQQSLTIACGCFTLAEGSGSISAWTAMRTVTLAALALTGLWAMHRKIGPAATERSHCTASASQPFAAGTAASLGATK